jgi:hypothetical protein
VRELFERSGFPRVVERALVQPLLYQPGDLAEGRQLEAAGEREIRRAAEQVLLVGLALGGKQPADL